MWFIEAVDIFVEDYLGLVPDLPAAPSDQLSLQELDRALGCRIIIAISLATHRNLETMLAENFLIIVGPICVHSLFRATGRGGH